jgi:hypothetical protein
VLSRRSKEITMSQTTQELKTELEKSVALLKTLRGEVRVKLHLAGMDVKDRWEKLQPHLDAAEHAAKEASDASRAAVVEAVKTLKAFGEYSADEWGAEGGR